MTTVPRLMAGPLTVSILALVMAQVLGATGGCCAATGGISTALHIATPAMRADNDGIVCALLGMNRWLGVNSKDTRTVTVMLGGCC